jgi:hypothetical protein
MRPAHLYALSATAALMLLPMAGLAQDSAAADVYQPLASDFHTLLLPNRLSGNKDVFDTSNIQFGKTFNAGFRYQGLEGSSDVTAAGAYFNPMLEREDRLTFGASIVDLGGDTDTQFELQAKYALASGFGLAATYFDNGISGQDALTALRLDYDTEAGSGGMRFNVASLAQRNFDPDGDGSYDVGAYVRLYSDKMVVGAGYDGEEVRALFNFALAKVNGVTPAVELLFVNSQVGDMDDGQFLLGSATLDFTGGFLAPVFSQGRVAGPSAVYYNNPVSNVSSLYNRAHDVWELGRILNFRVQGLKFGNTRTTDYQLAFYPAHVVEGDQGQLERLFFGTKHIVNSNNGLDDIDEPFVGYFGRLFGKLNASFMAGYDFGNSQAEITFGLVYLH